MNDLEIDLMRVRNKAIRDCMRIAQMHETQNPDKQYSFGYRCAVNEIIENIHRLMENENED